MEAEFRAELTELGYIHEVLADFGPQDTGVFNKQDLDRAMNFDNYAYNELTRVQEYRLESTGAEPPVMYLPVGGKFKRNIFRTMGVDWDEERLVRSANYFMSPYLVIDNDKNLRITGISF